MNKIVMIVGVSIVSLIFGAYQVIGALEKQEDITKLEEYSFKADEKIIEIIKYKNYKYIVTKYYDDSSSWSNLNFLLKEDKEYYMLDSTKKCDSLDEGDNLFSKDNSVYIHCIGKEGNINKYTIKDLKVEKEVLNLNYKNTPNISQLNIEIDKVDDNYIYLSSPFKMDVNKKEEPKVKCSLKNRTCSYY